MHRLGLILAMIGIFLTVPFFIVISMQMRSYVMLILPWPPIVGQLGALSVAIFSDRRAEPLFPRWFGYFNVWVALLLLPASAIIFFKTGPLAWTGVIGFWIPAAVFGVWYIVMTVILLRAISAEATSERAVVGALRDESVSRSVV